MVLTRGVFPNPVKRLLPPVFGEGLFKPKVVNH